MERNSPPQQKAQLDKAEREYLEDIVEDLRERVENNVSFQLMQNGLDDEPENADELDDEIEQLVEAIDLEAVDGNTWDEAFEQYVTGVGYTIVNRLAALRCMEVRDFIDEEVTVFKENGLTPAAETLVHEEFLLEDEATLKAYHNACDELAEEIEILFDRSSAYSLIDPDDDTFEELCRMLDEVPDEVWRADDVLGWVYEYYNTSQLSDVRQRMRTGTFDADDVAIANQFYTPYWVVRLLADNAIGKPYLAARGELTDYIERNRKLTTKQRIVRSPEYDESTTVGEFCTYVIPSEDHSAFGAKHPSEYRVLDPACGSGHFLLYSFDILERIWREMTDVPPGQIPQKILQNNLYGMDIDARACQLAAFNLYLKARQRAEAVGNTDFSISEVRIVCVDNQLSDTSEAQTVIETLAEDNRAFAESLESVLKDFQEKKGLGSLLAVKETLQEMEQAEQTEITTWAEQIPSLSSWIMKLHSEIEQNQENRFLYQNLQSFLRLLQFLTQNYDTILMNPPYGGRRRMPTEVQQYIKKQYTFKPEYYVNFIEQSQRLTKQDGAIGMLVPRSFMYKESFEDVRQELVEPEGSFDFDFLIEAGQGILDNATVRTVISVITSGTTGQQKGEFIQLSDVDPVKKEETFVDQLHTNSDEGWRHTTVTIEDFRKIPGSMLTYWAPTELRDLYTANTVFDADLAELSRKDIGSAKKGIATGKNDRFLRKKWECQHDHEWRPYAKGGERCWFYYPTDLRVLWDDRGAEITRFASSAMRNISYQGSEAVTWPLIKDSGHRFAKFDGGVSDDGGPCFYPDTVSIYTLTALLNSTVYTGLMLAQTPERQWNLSDIAILPYPDLSPRTKQRLEQLSAEMTELVADIESFWPTSGRYNELLERYESFEQFCQHRRAAVQSLVNSIREKQREINELVATVLNLTQSTIEQIRHEAELRYGSYDIIPYTVDDIPTETEDFCNRLLEYLVRSAVTNSEDGIVVKTERFQSGTELFDQVVKQIQDLFKINAEEVLSSIDTCLGTTNTGAVAYPNIERWIETEFFEIHTSFFENTPVIWELTTSRLVADPTGEGFACFVDYHCLDLGLFDRLSNQYLEPRKAELRERRSAANRRRNEDSLSASEQAEAAELYDRCASGLDQIAVFEDVIQELGSTDKRDFDAEDQQRVEELSPKVAAFREETRERVETLVRLRERKDEEWFKHTFSDKFWETVDSWREEWINALEELERACEAYAKSVDEPVEAHLADLFDYFNWRIKGSDHYSSSGILFMTYYFEREGADLLDEDGQPFDTLAEDERLLASLAMGIDDSSIVDEKYLKKIAEDEGVEDIKDLPPLAEFKALAEEIDDRCQEIDKCIPSDWANRALSEITTAGYQPKHKHGVEINITPLSDAEIVPKSVDDEVL